MLDPLEWTDHRRRPAVTWPARLLRLGAMLAASVLLSPAVARADPPGPTDYRTTVIGLEPASAGLEVEVVGGDSFISLTVARGVEVEVTGYRGEPYVWFRADGTVVENRRSPTYFANRSRFGAAIPAAVTPATLPEWVTVARDGTYAWHDHRTHWMNQFRPPGRRPGDVVLEATLPLVVDGARVSVGFRSTWLPSPSSWPVWIGLVVGLSFGAGILLTGAMSTAAAAAVAAGAMALWLGWWQVASVPAETGPSRLLIALPAVAAAAGLLAARRRAPASVVGRRVGGDCGARAGAVVVASAGGLESGAGAERRAGLAGPCRGRRSRRGGAADRRCGRDRAVAATSGGTPATVTATRSVYGSSRRLQSCATNHQAVAAGAVGPRHHGRGCGVRRR